MACGRCEHALCQLRRQPFQHLQLAAQHAVALGVHRAAHVACIAQHRAADVEHGIRQFAVVIVFVLDRLLEFGAVS